MVLLSLENWFDLQFIFMFTRGFGLLFILFMVLYHDCAKLDELIWKLTIFYRLYRVIYTKW